MIYVPVHFRRHDFVWRCEVWSTVLAQLLIPIIWTPFDCPQPSKDDDRPHPKINCAAPFFTVLLLEGLCLFLPDLWIHSISPWLEGRAPANPLWFRWYDEHRLPQVLKEWSLTTHSIGLGALFLDMLAELTLSSIGVELGSSQNKNHPARSFAIKLIAQMWLQGILAALSMLCFEVVVPLLRALYQFLFG